VKDLLLQLCPLLLFLLENLDLSAADCGAAGGATGSEAGEPAPAGLDVVQSFSPGRVRDGLG